MLARRATTAETFLVWEWNKSTAKGLTTEFSSDVVFSSLEKIQIAEVAKKI